MADLVREERCDLIIPYGDVGAVRGAMTKLRDDPGIRVELGDNGCRAFKECYDWGIIERRLLAAYAQLTITGAEIQRENL
jgi:glycosyltransferase involved in cell wall biosynthesis